MSGAEITLKILDLVPERLDLIQQLLMCLRHSFCGRLARLCHLGRNARSFPMNIPSGRSSAGSSSDEQQRRADRVQESLASAKAAGVDEALKGLKGGAQVARWLRWGSVAAVRTA